MSNDNGGKPEYEEIETDLPGFVKILNENGIPTDENETVDRFASAFLKSPALTFRGILKREDKPTLIIHISHTAIADAIYNRRKN